MVLVDSHCHLDFPEYENKEAEIIERAKEAGVGFFLTVGTTPEKSRQALQLTKRFPEVFAAVGIHPHDAKEARADDFAFFETVCDDKRVVAIGETGLDFYYTHSPREAQLEVFEKFLELSKKNNKPIIFHIRDAFDDFFRLIKKYQTGSLKGVMHCFTGTKEQALRALEFGLNISFTGILTYKKSGDLRETAKAVPLERILLETDCPFLAPEGYRGKVNEPAFLPIIAKTLAEVKGASLEEVAEKTTENCRKLFGFPVLGDRV